MASKKGAKRHHKQPAQSPRPGSRSTGRLVITTIVVAAVVVALWFWLDGRDTSSPADRAAENEPSAALSSPESARKLVGRWQRTDAGYVIEIRSVDRFGAVDAAYLNPNPIHVSQAQISDGDESFELFLELMDVGYPGATYRLLYSPEHDVLVGVYHQPTAGQDFEVAFERK